MPLKMKKNVSTATLKRLGTVGLRKKKTDEVESDEEAFAPVNTHTQLDENLKSCIASEKGLLSQNDFEHVMKVIEVFSKVLLFELR
jgi:hypothetical protein